MKHEIVFLVVVSIDHFTSIIIPSYTGMVKDFYLINLSIIHLLSLIPNVLNGYTSNFGISFIQGTFSINLFLKIIKTLYINRLLMTLIGFEISKCYDRIILHKW
jgi:hypothetical protein